MKPYIEDDVLFFGLNKNTDDFSFIVDEWGIVEVWWGRSITGNEIFVGKLETHFDEDVKDSLLEEGLNPDFESCNYVYINNEVVYLDNLIKLSYEEIQD